MMRKRKAMMYSIEGVIASLLLLSFFVSMDFSSPSYSWNELKIIEPMGDIVMVLPSTPLKTLVDENRGGALKDILNYFISPTARITVKTHGLPKQEILTGILMNDSDIIIRETDLMASCPTQIKELATCANGTIDGSIRFVALKLDGNFEYDRMYIDINSNGTYDSNEGPVGSSNLFTLSGDPYIMRSLSSDESGGVNATFWNATDIFPYFTTFKKTKINSKDVRLLFTSTDLTKKTEYYEKFDILLIPTYRNFTANEEVKLLTILDGGTSIIEIANLTNRVDTTQENVFGIKSAHYDVSAGSTTVLFNDDLMANDPLYLLNKYVVHSEISFSNLSTDVSGYTIPPFLDSFDKRIINMTLKGNTIAVLVVNHGTGYNATYFDLDANNNNFNFQDNQSYAVGQSVTIGLNKFRVASINPYSGNLELSLDEQHKFSGINSPSKIYPKTESTKDLVAYYQDKYYKNSTTNFIGKVFTFPTDVDYLNPTLPFGEHRNATLNVLTGTTYSIVATKTTANYTLWNIDLNGDGIYDDFGEGPYYTTEKIAIGPEIYQIFISGDGTKITAKLTEFWRVPYAIGHVYGKNSKTVWIEDDFKGDDFWNLIRGAIIWASSKEDTIISSYHGGDGVSSIKKTIVNDMEYLEFGEIELLISG